MTRRQRPRDTHIANADERQRDDWISARPADPQRNAGLQATVTTEQALLDAYPGSAESLATLAATLGIAWALTDASDVDD